MGIAAIGAGVAMPLPMTTDGLAAGKESPQRARSGVAGITAGLPQIYVIDGFGREPGDYHGDRVAAIIEAQTGLPVHRLDIGSSRAAGERSVLGHLQQIARDHDGSLDEVYINLSFGALPENSPAAVEYNAAVDAAVAELVARGAHVFVAEPNVGQDAAVLAPDVAGVTTVGVAGEAAQFSNADALADGRVRAVVLNDGRGVDVDGDSHRDFALAPGDVRSPGSVIGVRTTRGSTSFATPQVLSEAINAR